MIRIFPWWLLLAVAFPAAGQVTPLSKLSPDQPGCVDSKFFPRPLACRIDNCEKKDSDRRDVPVSEDEKGDAVITAMDGNSRSVMYECWTGTTPASIIAKAEIALKAAGFEVPYRFSDAEATLTARKDDLWITIEAASKYYTLVEMNAVPPDFESAIDADSIAEMLESYGHVPLNGVQFLGPKGELAPASSAILAEVVTLMKDHPAWRLRVEGHTDNQGPKTANLNVSYFRASSVVNWLAANGVKRARLDPKGMGDTNPIADNTTETGRAKNQRIELVLVKVAGMPSQ